MNKSLPKSSRWIIPFRDHQIAPKLSLYSASCSHLLIHVTYFFLWIAALECCSKCLFPQNSALGLVTPSNLWIPTFNTHSRHLDWDHMLQKLKIWFTKYIIIVWDCINHELLYKLLNYNSLMFLWGGPVDIDPHNCQLWHWST